MHRQRPADRLAVPTRLPDCYRRWQGCFHSRHRPGIVSNALGRARWLVQMPLRLPPAVLDDFRAAPGCCSLGLNRFDRSLEPAPTAGALRADRSLAGMRPAHPILALLAPAPRQDCSMTLRAPATDAESLARRPRQLAIVQSPCDSAQPNRPGARSDESRPGCCRQQPAGVSLRHRLDSTSPHVLVAQWPTRTKPLPAMANRIPAARGPNYKAMKPIPIRRLCPEA